MIVLHAIFILALAGLENKLTDFNRHLLIFGIEKNEKMVKEQTTLLANEDSAVKERDIKISVVKAGSNLHTKYDVQIDKFTVILVGKDGTEKMRTSKLLQPAELFAIIDAMPMRKREMRKQ